MHNYDHLPLVIARYIYERFSFTFSFSILNWDTLVFIHLGAYRTVWLQQKLDWKPWLWIRVRIDADVLVGSRSGSIFKKKTLGFGSRSGFFKYPQCSVLKKSGKTITTSLDFLTLFFFQQKTCLINMYLTFFPAVLIRSDTRSIILRGRGWVWCRSFSVFALFPIALFLLISLCCGCCKTKEVQTLSALKKSVTHIFPFNKALWIFPLKSK